MESKIYIVSDSVGDTAETFAKASLIQFQNYNFSINRISFVDTLEKIDQIVENASKDDAIIVYTLIKPEMRAYLELQSKEADLITYDVFGSFIAKLEKKLNTKAVMETGLTHKLDEAYFKRIEAIEFAVKYDDGRDPKGIEIADIVLIGVSRTSKTPLSQHLAHKGYKVANIPLVPEVEPAEELFKIDSNKCIGLVTSPEKLNEIRKERLIQLGLHDNAFYANIDRIETELNHFNQIVERLQCPVVDVSNKAIEETANEIIQIIKNKK